MGDAIQYQVVVKNTGNVTLHNVTLSDTLTALNCMPAAPVASPAPNATITCTGTYLVMQGDLDAGTVNNTATADSDETAPSSDSETATASKTPTLSIDKTITSGGSYSQVGDAIQYQVVVKNTGNVTLHNVTLSDTLTALSCTPAAPVASLAPNATITCTGTYLVTQGGLDAGTVNNTHATADSDETAPSSDSETATASKTPHL